MNTIKMRSIISRTKTLNIADFLLKQNYFSGVGNYLKSEILYHSRLNPFRNISSLSDNDIYVLYIKSIEIIKQEYDMGGMTIKSFINPFGVDGSNGPSNGGFIPMIYGKTTDPYMNEVKSSNNDGKSRRTYLVSSIQI